MFPVDTFSAMTLADAKAGMFLLPGEEDTPLIVGVTGEDQQVTAVLCEGQFQGHAVQATNNAHWSGIAVQGARIVVDPADMVITRSALLGRLIVRGDGIYIGAHFQPSGGFGHTILVRVADAPAFAKPTKDLYFSKWQIVAPDVAGDWRLVYSFKPNEK